MTRNLRRCLREGDWRFFCSDHSRQWVVWVFTLFTVLAGFASLGLFSLRGREEKGIDENTKRLIDTNSKAAVPELQKVFPGGFETFGVLTGGSATAGHTIVRSSTSYSIDITWGKATITELTPGNLTLNIQNLRITRTETTPGGIQPAGTMQINGAAVWSIDRGRKVVSINNAISFWGYVLGGFVISDTDNVIVVAMGLQVIK